MFVHIVSRKEANRIGMSRYFTGVPCRNGHIAERQTRDAKCLECKRSKDRRYYKSNKVKIMDKVKRWREDNPDQARRNWETWYFRDVDKTRMMSRNTAHRRRVRERGGGGVSRSDITRWALGREKVCFYCRKECSEDFQIDHFYPISKGGRHEIENIVISCSKCNRRKSNKDPYDFMKEMGDE